MEYWAISNPLLRYSITPLLPSAIVQLTPFHCPIRRFDIVRETVFTFPIFRSRYAQLFFYFVQRFTLLRHLLHPSHERIIVAFHVVEDFDRARIPMSRDHDLGVKRFHHLDGGKGVRNTHKRTQIVKTLDAHRCRCEEHSLFGEPDRRVRLAVTRSLNSKVERFSLPS